MTNLTRFFIGSLYTLFSLSVKPVIAADFYVSPNGLDSNPGNLLQPVKTISKAIAISSEGDTIYIKTGTYPSFDVSKNRLTITGYSGEYPLISGGTGIKLSGSDISLSNIEVTGMSAPKNAAILSTGNRNIINNNIVRDNISSDTNGIIVTGANTKVENNTVYNNNRMGIGIYNGSNNIITKNTVYKNNMSAGDSDGIHCIGDSVGQSHDNIISYNIVFENADDGIDTWNCVNNQIDNNISYHNGGTGDGHGIKLGLGGRNKVINNTAYANLACGFTSNGGGNEYQNNISYDNRHCGFTDSYRVLNNTDPSSFRDNYAFNNSENYIRGPYTLIFINNKETAPTSSLSPKLGDANGDRKVDGVDYVVWINNFGKNILGVANGDFNNNNNVDGIDYVVWLNNFEK